MAIIGVPPLLANNPTRWLLALLLHGMVCREWCWQCLLTTQLANKPQPSLGHAAASLCDHLCSVPFYWLQFLWQFLCLILWKVCCKVIQPYSKVLGVLFGIETMVHRGMHKLMQWISFLKDKRRHIGCFGILSFLSLPPEANLIFGEQFYLVGKDSD